MCISINIYVFLNNISHLIPRKTFSNKRYVFERFPYLQRY